MAREILFKAKRIDNGEWIIGNLVLSDDVEDDYKAIIIPTNDACMFTKGGAKGDLGFEHWHRVDETTICQYTGLTDKNGNKIWENDVVHLFGIDTIREYDWKAVVEFGNPNSLYSWGYQLKPIRHFEYNEDILCWVGMEEANIYCDVIGNIFDNPELLEVLS